MPAEVAYGVAEAIAIFDGVLKSPNHSGGAKESRETERRRRRRKQRKNKQNAAAGDDSDTAAEDAYGTAYDSSKEKSDPQKDLGLVEVEYVLEKVELDCILDEEFNKVFKKFKFSETAATETDKKNDNAPDAASKKDSDSEEDEQDDQQK